ncbi:hypothetical protein ACJMK2_022767 [Sinanodonta woodiana]|uniref:Sclerostin domain-containing protein 1 n=1 Tax=Sinanodonta woodiana TaxID=1069815 RepID=A0ABD3TLB6_SINWO
MSQPMGILFLCVTLLETLLHAAKLPNLTNGSLLVSSNTTVIAKSDFTNFKQWPDNIQIGCRELRAKRYISDGYCTSIKPIREVVCAGQCYPIKEQNLPWWSEFTKYWSKNKLKEWRCEEAVTRRKNVQLICGNGEVRTYKKIKVVKSCRCKFYAAEHNKSHRRDGKSGNKPRTRTRRKGRKGRSRKDMIGLSQNTSSETTQQR